MGSRTCNRKARRWIICESRAVCCASCGWTSDRRGTGCQFSARTPAADASWLSPFGGITNLQDGPGGAVEGGHGHGVERGAVHVELRLGEVGEAVRGLAQVLAGREVGVAQQSPRREPVVVDVLAQATQVWHAVAHQAAQLRRSGEVGRRAERRENLENLRQGRRGRTLDHMASL